VSIFPEEDVAGAELAADDAGAELAVDAAGAGVGPAQPTNDAITIVHISTTNNILFILIPPKILIFML
jgi:hypothetical protein